VKASYKMLPCLFQAYIYTGDKENVFVLLHFFF